MSKIIIITDFWYPQINGTVTAIDKTAREMRRKGHEVRIVSPNTQSVFCVTLQSYQEVRLDLLGGKRARREIECFAPDYIHIATEGPLGIAARNLCVEQKRPYTTAFHTNLAAYVATRAGRGANGIARLLGHADAEAKAYDFLRWFHGPAAGLMVATDIVGDHLRARGFTNLAHLPLGVDVEQFQPYGKDFAPFAGLARPILLYMGRIAVEKNIEAFLAQDTPGTKVVVGDGPIRRDLEERYPEAHFTGSKTGEDLARHVAAADLFVFPSRTDTYGLVLLEALACGVPVVAYPEQGPKEVLDETTCGGFSRLDTDIGAGIRVMLDRLGKGALDIPGARAYAERHSWSAAADKFLAALETCSPSRSQPAYGGRRAPRHG